MHFTTFWSRCNVLACEVQACTESKKCRHSRMFLWHSSLEFYFSLSLLTSFFTFLASVFFLFCWVFGRLHFGGKLFRKAIRILGLDERKGMWVVEQDFHGNFQVNGTCFFLHFSLVSLAELCLFCCCLKDLFIVLKLVNKVVLDH